MKKFCGEARKKIGNQPSEYVGKIHKIGENQFTVTGWGGIVGTYSGKDFKRDGGMNLGYAYVKEFLLLPMCKNEEN